MNSVRALSGAAKTNNIWLTGDIGVAHGNRQSSGKRRTCQPISLASQPVSQVERRSSWQTSRSYMSGAYRRAPLHLSQRVTGELLLLLNKYRCLLLLLFT